MRARFDCVQEERLNLSAGKKWLFEVDGQKANAEEAWLRLN